MKKLLLIISLSLITSFLSAQLPMGYYESISFDPPHPVFISINVPDSTILKIDTSIAGNIWQIGKPHKTIFDSAYSRPNAIVTDTIHYYPANNFSTFTVKIFDPAWMSLTSPSPCINFSFMHKFDTDSLKDGGYVEISYNNGITWTNLANDTIINWYPSNFYNQGSSPNPIIANGNAAFTGSSHGWQQAVFAGVWDFRSNPYPVYLRFVFSSDSVVTNKEGWMIDDIGTCMGCAFCIPGIEEEQGKGLISIYPNPATNDITIEGPQAAIMEIFDIQGQTIIQQTVRQGKTNIDISGLAKGVYILRMLSNDRAEVTRIVKE